MRAGPFVAVLLALCLAACGSSSTAGSASSAIRSVTSSAAAATVTPAPALAAAERPRPALFPSAHGRTLRQLVALAHGTLGLSPTTQTLTPAPRPQRYAFGLLDSAGTFAYAPTALYLAATPSTPASGPYLAPADPLGVAPRFRSRQNAGPDDIRAIYEAQLPLPHAGAYALLAVTRTAHGLQAAAAEIAVAGSSPIPGVGQRPPAIATDTLASVHGDVALLTTRQPPEHMSTVPLDRVLGHRPVALLFSTPQLCTSRVCGPVTDELVALQAQFGQRITFIHQEIYVDNDPAKGLRPQMRAFHLRTEPWLFAINRRGIIVARLQGAFGIHELRAALQAALA